MKTISSEFDIPHSVLRLVKSWAIARSKDPSTKVGAGIYDFSTGGLYLGYNGFPPGIADKSEWWNNRGEDPTSFTKYDLCIHAEVNAKHKALMCGASLTDSILVVSHHPCAVCARDVILTSKFMHVYYESEELKCVTPECRQKVRQLMNFAGIPLTQIKQKEI